MKRLAGLILILVAVFSLAIAGADSLQTEEYIGEYTFPVTIETGSGISSEQAAENYIMQAFGFLDRPSGGTLLDGTVELTGANKILYDELVKLVLDVAAGRETSTVCEIPLGNLGITKWSYSKDDLGVDTIVGDDGQVNDEAIKRFYSAVNADMGLDLVLVGRKLRMDFPYEMYWASSYFPSGGGYPYYPDENGILIDPDWTLTYNMYVSADYSASGADKTTECKPDFGIAVENAVANANAIVEKNKGNSDYAKLRAYKDIICDMTSYNHQAAETEGYPYGNPWQAIWALDGNPETEVVCEGYSKAFKYLCDLSTFNDVSASIVIGTMDGGTGAGGHMWNLVQIQGKQYLVDVTNCDEYSIGYPDQLFLKGYDELSNGWYVYFIGDEYVAYLYDEQMYNLYAAEDLIASESDYEVPFIMAQPTEVGVGEEMTLTAGIPQKESIHIGQKKVNGIIEDMGGELGNEYSLCYTLVEAGEYEFCVGYTDENENTVHWMTDVSVQVTVNVVPIVHSLCGMERRFFIGMDYNPEQAEYGKVISDSYIDILYVENSAACQEAYTGEPIWTILENGEVPTHVDLRTDASGRMELYLKAMPTQAQDVEYEIQCEWDGKVGSGIYTIHFAEAPNGLPTSVQFTPANHLAIVKAGTEFEYNISFADWNGPQDGEYFRDLSENLNDVMGDGLIPEVPGIYEGYMETGCENILWREPLTVIVTNADGTMSASLYTPRGIVEYLPADLQQIEEKAFENVLMTEVDIPEGVNFIAGDAFDGCGLVAMYVHHNQIAVDFALDHGIIALTD